MFHVPTRFSGQQVVFYFIWTSIGKVYFIYLIFFGVTAAIGSDLDRIRGRKKKICDKFRLEKKFGTTGISRVIDRLRRIENNYFLCRLLSSSYNCSWFTVPVAATVAPERPQPTRNCQWQGWLEKGGMEGVGRVVKLQQRPVVQKRTPLSCEKGGRSGRDGEEKPGSASPTAASPSPSSPSPPTAAATAAPRQLPFRSERSTTSDPSLLQLMIQPKSFSAATLSRRNFFRGQKPLLGLS